MARTRQYKLEYYVLNGDFNTKTVAPWNVFNNIHVADSASKALDQLYAGKMSFSDFVDEIDHAVQWQEWSRVEYEIAASQICADEQTKIDCYAQYAPNKIAAAAYIALINATPRKRERIALEIAEYCAKHAKA